MGAPPPGVIFKTPVDLKEGITYHSRGYVFPMRLMNQTIGSFFVVDDHLGVGAIGI